MSMLVGPVAALLYEIGRLRVFRNDHAGDAWFVAALAAFGVGMAVFAKLRGATVTAVVSLVVNAAVLGLYAFVAAFFTMGGSR